MEELATGDKAAAGVDAEEDEDDDRGDGADDVSVIVETVAVEAGKRDGVARDLGVAPQALGDEQPVEVGSQRKPDGGPADVCGAGEVRESRQAHEQVAGHVGRLCGKGREPRADLAAAQEVLGRR